MSKNVLKAIIILLLAAVTTACSNDSDGGERASINGTELYYKTMGSGEPIVVVHGGPMLSHQYLLPHLKPLAKNYRLIFYDQRLSGRSSAQVDSSAVTIQNFVDDIEGLRKELELGKIHLLAHSWGGLLAMKYAIQYPQHVNKLILSNSIPASEKLWQQQEIALSKRTTANYRKERRKITSTEAFRKGRPEAVEELLLLDYSQQFHDSSQVKKLDLYIPQDYRERSGRFGLLMSDLRSFNLFPKLKKLQVPTLIIYGSDEPAAELNGQKMDQTIPKSKLVVIEQSGHFPFIEQPDQFLNAVRSFLN